MTKFAETLIPAIKGGSSLYHCETMDQLALEDEIKKVCATLGYNFFVWTPYGGITCLYYTDRVQKDSHGYWMAEPSVQQEFNNDSHNHDCSAVELVARMTSDPDQDNDRSNTLIPTRSIIVARFLDKFLGNAVLLSTIVDGIALSLWGVRAIRFILTAPMLDIDKQVLKYSTPLTLDLPNEEEIKSLTLEVMKLAVDAGTQKISDAKKMNNSVAVSEFSKSWFNDQNNADLLVPHLKGLTLFSIKRAVYLVAARHHCAEIEPVIRSISEYKMQVVENSKVLRFLPYDEQGDENLIGGFDNLLDFIKVRKNAFSEEARKQNLDTPKGVVLLGRPGTGKSLAAKAMGRMLGDLPVVVMDVGSLFGSLVGESEARVREALKIIDGINGCVLLIDEADKAFAGNNSGTSGDSGTSQRVLGSVLNWLNDHKSKTFVVLTLNRIDTLPPELLRAGRFDKTFYTDLPTPNERKTIFLIHLRKRLDPINEDIDFSDDDWLDILEATDGYVGAEIEEVVKDARLRAFNRIGIATPSADDILSCCNDRTPMAQSDAINQEMMTNCRKFATPVSKRPYKPEIDEN